MNTSIATTGLFVGFLALAGCADRSAEEARQAAEAEARAEAARKEMEALPKTFETPDYFKKTAPAKPAEPTTDATAGAEPKAKTPEP